MISYKQYELRIIHIDDNDTDAVIKIDDEFMKNEDYIKSKKRRLLLLLKLPK